ncbi:MAG: peptidase M4 [Luteitalea sp.]|nr:peptidase M4 [Luteitalea sp.]
MSDEPTSADDRFEIGPRVAAAARVAPHQRQRGEPLYRPLRVFAIDPAASRLDGAVATVNVPYEPVAPGPVGALFEVDDYDRERGRHYARLDLNDPFPLMHAGRAPAAADPQFHQQMVYAVASRVYVAFKKALGRNLAWGFTNQTQAQLLIRPHAFVGRNAFYDRDAGEIAFGYFAADSEVVGMNLPGGTIFTCLSHDIVAHETTHALLDGLRAYFAVPTGPDVLAVHEALADLVALFLHFEYRPVVRSAIQRCRGDLRQPSVLADLAQQFGQTTGAGLALRHTLDDLGGGKPTRYDPGLESHALGGILVAAVYEAFTTICQKKTKRVIRLATGGTGQLPNGDLPVDLVDELVDKVGRIATQFLTVCVRAVDYCPTVDIEFGELLRALITADADLVPSDPWAYREALIDAFRRRGIYPAGVPNLSEEALRWEEPAEPLPPIPGLDFAVLKFKGDPASAADIEELRRQACALGKWLVASDAAQRAFGLAAPDPSARIYPPCVESIRTLRRVGPDGQVVFDLVAEVTQRRTGRVSPRGAFFEFTGGATVIVGPEGVVRYVIRKRITNDERLERQRQYMTHAGRRYWARADGALRPASSPFRLLHRPRGAPRRRSRPA